MRKTALRAIVLSFLILAVLMSAHAQGYATVLPGGEEPVSLYISGELVDTYGLICVLGEEILVPLRPVSNALGAVEVNYDPEDYSASVQSNGLDIYVPFEKQYFEANGRYFFTERPITVINERCLVPLGDLMRAFGAEYTYDPAERRIDVMPTHVPIKSGSSFYDDDDLYWLSRIIQAESGGESLTGKIAVGNVVLNRVADESFPSTVKEVIFDRTGGVQFTPAYSGSIYNTPSDEAVIAAKLALEGVMIVENGLYFTPTRTADTCWASRHFAVVAEIGGHVFFG